MLNGEGWLANANRESHVPLDLAVPIGEAWNPTSGAAQRSGHCCESRGTDATVPSFSDRRGARFGVRHEFGDRVRSLVVEWRIEQRGFFASTENGIVLEALGRF